MMQRSHLYSLPMTCTAVVDRVMLARDDTDQTDTILLGNASKPHITTNGSLGRLSYHAYPEGVCKRICWSVG